MEVSCASGRASRSQHTAHTIEPGPCVGLALDRELAGPPSHRHAVAYCLCLPNAPPSRSPSHTHNPPEPCTSPWCLHASTHPGLPPSHSCPHTAQVHPQCGEHQASQGRPHSPRGPNQPSARGPSVWTRLAARQPLLSARFAAQEMGPDSGPKVEGKRCPPTVGGHTFPSKTGPGKRTHKQGPAVRQENPSLSKVPDASLGSLSDNASPTPGPNGGLCRPSDLHGRCPHKDTIYNYNCIL